MRVLVVLTLVGGLLVGAAPPSEDDLGRRADRLIATSDIPGVIALVELDGRRTVVAAGHADLVRRREMRPDDRFWVGSVTKSFVATVVLQLVGERRLGLDDSVEQFLPGRVREGERVHLRHLLEHTSGIPDYMRLEPWSSAVARNPRVVIPATRLVTSAARLPLEFPPGSRASYSNTNYLVLGEIVEQVTGRSLGRVLRERIFGPLGLHGTHLESGRRTVGRAQIHGYDVTWPQPKDVSLHGLGGPWADGAIVSSARDLAVFFGALLRGKLVSPPLLAQMTTIVPGSHGGGLGLYRLGSPCSRRYYGHTGGTPGYATFAASSRDGRRVVVVAVNGISRVALGAMGRFLDGLLCR